MGTLYRIFEKSNIVCISNDKLYYYRRNRQGSITDSTNFEKDPDRMEFVFQWQKKLIELNCDYPEKYDDIKILYAALDYLVKRGRESYYLDKKAYSVIKRLIKNKDYIKSMSNKHVLLLFLCIYAKPVFNFVCTFFNKRQKAINQV